MKRPFDPAVEDVHQVEPAAVGLIGVNAHNVMAALLQPFPRFADLHTIAATRRASAAFSARLPSFAASAANSRAAFVFVVPDFDSTMSG